MTKTTNNQQRTLFKTKPIKANFKGKKMLLRLTINGRRESFRYYADEIEAAAGNVEKGTAGKLFFWHGLAASIVVTVLVTRVASNALKHAVPQTTAETTKIE